MKQNFQNYLNLRSFVLLWTQQLALACKNNIKYIKKTQYFAHNLLKSKQVEELS